MTPTHENFLLYVSYAKKEKGESAFYAKRISDNDI